MMQRTTLYVHSLHSEPLLSVQPLFCPSLPQPPSHIVPLCQDSESPALLTWKLMVRKKPEATSLGY
ncbi:hypothetical protein E2C01_010998 [Portunus trituberculatus]|uniref:Uncharacterized protein n=1 Tax=Portunus trituberculatus TaxID=210409 RepID=A0A5B7DA81_PORTR|nr:hypothetical protein [Portunus trituberculatus]